MQWYLAQVNIGRLRAPVDDPLIAEFVAGLDRINALADLATGFVWRLQTEDGNATAVRPVEDDELLAINMSVWESVEALADYVYRSEHVALLRRRHEWFERFGTSYLALWWIPAGTIPTVPEAMARIVHPLRPETLRSPLLHGDAVFEIGGMPRWDLSGGSLQQLQDAALKIWFADRMLGNEPGRLGAIFACDFFCRPAMLGNQLS